MANNLYALIGPVGAVDVRRVRVSADVQNQLAGLFVAYDASFREEVEEEIPFTRDWKPDDDQLLTLDASNEVNELLQRLQAGPLALDEIATEHFDNEQVRALLFVPDDDANVVYVQYFFAHQRLSRRALTLIVDGNTFTRLTGPAFAIGAKIDPIIEGGAIKFKNFNVIKRIFDVLANYTVASDEEIVTFSQLPTIHVEDVNKLISKMTQTNRKLITAVAESGILDRVSVDDIVNEAAALGINVAVADGSIVLPKDRGELKALLRF